MQGLSHDEAKTIAEEAATKALGSFFRYFDIDVNDPDSLKEFRNDLRYLADTRKGTEDAKKMIRNAVVPTAILAVAVAVFAIFRDGLREFMLQWLAR
jgi:hypothetical protein